MKFHALYHLYLTSFCTYLYITAFVNSKCKKTNASWIAYWCEAVPNKIHCCFHINHHCHISELVNASHVRNICASQIEVEFAAPSKICFMENVTYLKQWSYNTPGVILTGGALQHPRILQFKFCSSNTSPASVHKLLSCESSITVHKLIFRAKTTHLSWKESYTYRSVTKFVFYVAYWYASQRKGQGL